MGGRISLVWITDIVLTQTTVDIYWDSTVPVPVAKLANCKPGTPPSSGGCVYFTETAPTNPISVLAAPPEALPPCWAIGIWEKDGNILAGWSPVVCRG
ncbi:hypothetical protein IIA16_02550 [bacterium]|nr:hypothetical protein [bacterium]